MKRIAAVVFLIFVFLSCAGQKKISKKYQLREDRPVLMMFTASWCAPCRYMKDKVFTDKNIVPLLSEYNVLLIDIDSMEGKDYQMSYCGNNTAVPHFIILGIDRKVIIEQKGASSSISSFAEFLKKGFAGIDFKEEKEIAVNFIHIPEYTGKKFITSWDFGVEAGFLAANLPGSIYDGFVAGYYGGGVARFKASRVVSIDMGLDIFSKGGKDREKNNKISLVYVAVPVDLDFRLGGFFYAGFGLYTSVRINSIKEDYSKADFGLRINLSAEFGKIRIKTGYSKGVVNMLKSNIVDNVTNGCFGLGVEYVF